MDEILAASARAPLDARGRLLALDDLSGRILKFEYRKEIPGVWFLRNGVLLATSRRRFDEVGVSISPITRHRRRDSHRIHAPLGSRDSRSAMSVLDRSAWPAGTEDLVTWGREGR